MTQHHHLTQNKYNYLIYRNISICEPRVFALPEISIFELIRFRRSYSFSREICGALFCGECQRVDCRWHWLETVLMQLRLRLCNPRYTYCSVAKLHTATLVVENRY